MVRSRQALTIFLVFWLVCLIVMLVNFMGKSTETEALMQSDLNTAQMKNHELEIEIRELRSTLQALRKAQEASNSDHENNLHPFVAGDEPTREYEVSRRLLHRDVNEMWWYVKSTLQGLVDNPDLPDQLKADLKDNLAEAKLHSKTILSHLNQMMLEDGHNAWRKQEAKDLSDLVQARLHSLQNPSDCDNAKKLVCNLNKGCGYGCQIHHAIYCFIVAYGTERMLVLKSKGWRYDKAGFEDVFLPLSETCPNPSISHKSGWPGRSDTLVVELGIVDSVNPRPKFLPPSIPKDLADRIVRLHGDPIVWWVSQFLKYMLRPQPELEAMLKSAEKAQQLEHPVVGIHIRRTDKVGTEAAFHGVAEYMKHVDEYFEEQEVIHGKKIPIRRVYVATDDPKVLGECRKSYPEYVFLGDQTVAKSAAVSTRYSTSSLRGIITDIHMLSKTDFLVCTFSSQVCRIAYEVMQQFHVDAADRFKSLDDIWYFGGQDEHQQVAYMAHSAKDKSEMDLEVGDVIGVAGNHWNGLNKGKNHRSRKIGLYPSYKTKEVIKIEDFPTYPNVKL